MEAPVVLSAWLAAVAMAGRVTVVDAVVVTACDEIGNQPIKVMKAQDGEG